MKLIISMDTENLMRSLRLSGRGDSVIDEISPERFLEDSSRNMSLQQDLHPFLNKNIKKTLLRNFCRLMRQRIMAGASTHLALKRDSIFGYSVGKIIKKIVPLSRAFGSDVIFVNGRDYARLYKVPDIEGSDTRDESFLEQLHDFLHEETPCLDDYRHVHHIGDIHGCIDDLKATFPQGLDDRDFHVFHGDYIDRGPESGKVLKWLLKNGFHGGRIQPNVVLLSGNHEYHLKRYLAGKKPVSKSFVRTSLQQVSQINTPLLQRFVDNLRPSLVYERGGRTIVCCHGNYPNNDIFSPMDAIPLHSLHRIADCTLQGMNIDRKTNIGERYVNSELTCFRNTTFVYGHFHIEGTTHEWHDKERNISSYCLENRVERGGSLMVASL